MITLTVLRQTVAGLDEAELEEWIAQRWVQPEEGPDGYRFEDIDVARVRLITVLRHEFELDARALPVVLSLLDQLHEAQRVAHALHARLHDTVA